MSTRAGRLVVPQGADWEYGWPIFDRDRSAPPLTLAGWTAKAQARPDPDSDVVLAEWTADNGGLSLVPGSIATDGTRTEAEVVLRIAAALSSAWRWESAHYDIKVVDQLGRTARIVTGRMFVSAAVTR